MTTLPDNDRQALNKIAEEIVNILADPCASDWLKHALASNCPRDPVDAAHDADFLAKLMARRAKAVAEAALHAGALTPREHPDGFPH